MDSRDTMRQTSQTEIGLATCLAYSAPALPLAALGVPLFTLIPTYYSETMGLPLATVGLSLFAIRLLDAVTDPFLGALSDRVRPPHGRRKTIFAISLFVAAVAGLLLYWPPQDVTALWLLGWGSLLSVGLTLASVSYAAWGAELASGYHARTVIVAWREGLGLVGILMAIIIPFSIGLDPGPGLSGLAVLGICVAVALPLCGLVTLGAVPEPIDRSIRRLSIAEGFGFLRRNRQFVRLVAAYFLNGFANGIPATLFLYFVSDRLGAPAARGPLLVLYFACGIAGVPLASWTARHLGKHRAWCWGMLLACLVFAATPFIASDGVVVFALICAATGLMLGFDLTLPPSIQADVIDLDTAVSGEQRSGLYFAAWGLATKASLAAGVGLIFPILSWFGFQAGAGVANSAQALLALALLYAWVPIGLKLAAVALMWNFPVDEGSQPAASIPIAGRSPKA